MGRLALILILAVGIVLRAFRLDWGLPGYVFPDAAIHFIHPAIVAAAGGPLVPPQFVHPTVVFLLLTGAFRVWSLVTGRPIDPVLASPQFWTFTLVGRVVMLILAGLSILLVFTVARRLVGQRAALLASACFALAPLHVLESHRIGPDIPMILLALLAMQLALAAAARRRTATLLGAFACAGLAAATKYTGVFTAAVPAWAAAGWPLGRRGRWALVVTGGVAVVAGFALGCAPCFFALDRFERGLRLIGTYGYLVGMPGVDLTGAWPQQRWVYPLVVAFPYMLGWPVYVAALAGLALLWRRDRRAAGFVLAAIGPYFLFMGGAISAVPRYYLLLAPGFAIAAGACLDALWGAGRGGVAAVGAILAYTAALSASQVARLGLGPQRDVGRVVAALASDAAREGRQLVVAYPNRFALPYDAVRPELLHARVRIVEFPAPYGHLAAEVLAPLGDAGSSPAAEEPLAADVVVLPSWVENAVRRARPDGQTATFFHRLGTGELGYRSAGEFRQPFLTERLYTWGDPMLDTHWETAIAGYKVFVRSPTTGEAR
jgi:hypothetical protein